ncbi:hypothetical protein BaRGS_00008361 [Batillaria attramentaria]|uniref:Neurotransmitter-gated ion-channel ligand-binding domain-containing protein n=1 Tax=Batillaria attramentaria TaxID=370345 RepID=A0ABD0LN66_9CAEN
MAGLRVVFLLCFAMATSISTVAGIAYKYDHLYNMVKSVEFAHTVPVMENGDPVQVGVNLDIQRIVAMDPSTQEMVADALLRLRWSDFRVAWNQYMVSSVNTLVWPNADSTWTPDVVVTNGPGSTFDSSPEVSAMRLDHVGNVTWYRRLRVRVPCDVSRLDNAPDVTCLISLASWSHDSQDLELVTSHSYTGRQGSDDDVEEDHVSRYRVTLVGVTKSSKASSCCPTPFDVINYRVTVTRR